MIYSKKGSRIQLVAILNFIVIFSLIPASSLAFTVTDPEIAASATWTKDQSPYVISGSLVIDQGSTLTIEPGVAVQLQEGASIDSFGNIQAIGTPADPVVISGSRDGSGAPNDAGITLSGMDRASRFENVRFEDLDDGIRLDQAQGIFKGASFMNAQSGIYASASHVEVASSTFASMGQGSALTLWNSTASVQDSSFRAGQRHGIEARGGSTLSMASSTVSGFLQDGIRTDKSPLFIDRSVIEGNGTGIEVMAPFSAPVLASVLPWNAANFFSLLRGFAQSFIAPLYADSAASPGVQISQSVIRHNSHAGAVSGDASVSFIATNDFWGDASGPQESARNPGGKGDAVLGNVIFAPWLTDLPGASKRCCSNVAFLPGFEGSRLYSASPSEAQLWEPSSNGRVRSLFLDATGKSVNPVYAKDVIDHANILIHGPDIYESFLKDMDALVASGQINAWKPLPYDWRMSPESVVRNGVSLPDGKTSSLVAEIEALAGSSRTGKVSIVAHSNGGLVAKALAAALAAKGEAGLIDQVVLVAVPQLGTPEAVAALLHGEDQEIFHGALLDKPTARQFGQNMLGAYHLLPSAQYFSAVPNPIVTFDPSIESLNRFRTAYGNSVSSLAGLQAFLSGKDGRAAPPAADILSPALLGKGMLDQAADFHRRTDSASFPDGMRVTQVAGWGLSTLSGIKYEEKNLCVPGPIPAAPSACSSILDHEPVITRGGDGVVVAQSATALKVPTYYIDLAAYNSSGSFFATSRTHKDILEAAPARSLVGSLLAGVQPSSSPFVSTSTPKAVLQTVLVSVHSPVSLEAYDARGNHTGAVPNPDPNSDLRIVEQNIPNSSYFEFGEGKYLALDQAALAGVKLAGLDAGTFTLDIEQYAGDQQVRSESFSGIPTTPSMKAELVQGGTALPRLKVDLAGDGRNPVIIQPTQSLLGPQARAAERMKIMRAFIQFTKLEPGSEEALLRSLKDIDDEIGSNQLLRAEDLLRRLPAFYRTRLAAQRGRKDSQQDEKLARALDQLVEDLFRMSREAK